MTIVNQFDQLEEHEKINKLKAQMKDLRLVNREHKKLVGNLYKEIDSLRKDMALVKEDNQLLNMEMGRLMKKIAK